MSMLKKLMVSILIVFMVFASIPMEVYNTVYAYPVELANSDGGSSISQGESGSVGSFSNLTQSGGVRTSTIDQGYRAAIRVSVLRDSDLYMDGTSETRNRMISAYDRKYPQIDTYTDSITFIPYDLPQLYKDRELGVGLYNRQTHELDWTVTDHTDKLLVRLRDKTNTNIADGVIYNKGKTVIQNANILKSDASGENIEALSNGNWKQYASQISFNEALTLWEHVLMYDITDGYKLTERLDGVISQFVVGTTTATNLQEELSEGEKQDIAAGYVGVLMSLYRVAEEQGLQAQQGVLSKAIEDYVSSNDITNKPVAIVMDTAVPMVLHLPEGTKGFIFPSIDYQEFIGLVPGDISTVSAPGVGVDSGILTPGDTRQQFLDGANEGLVRWPLWSTKHGDGKLRYGDLSYLNNSLYTEHQKALGQQPLGWSASVPGFKNTRLSTRDGVAAYHHSSVNAGFIGMLTFAGNIKGFTVTSYNIVEQESKPTYKVDNKLKEMIVDNTGRAVPSEPNKISFYIKGESSLISILEARIRNGSNPEMSIEGKVLRETYEEGVLTETKQEVTDLTTEFTRTSTGGSVIEVLQGQIQLLNDVSVLSDEFQIDNAGNYTVKYVYYLEDVKIIIDNLEKDYTWQELVYEIDGIAQNYAEHIAQITTRPDDTCNVPTDRIVVAPPAYDTPQIEEWYPSTMVAPYTYSTTDGKQYAEIKNNTIGSENYEVMAGVPTTEELYFSAGGTEYMVSMVLQYWMNETGVERTYRSYYDGVACEFKAGDTAGSYTVPSPTGATSSNLTVNAHTGGTVYAEWSYTVANQGTANPLTGFNAGTPGSPCAGNGGTPGTPGDITWTDKWNAKVYNDAVKNSNEFKAALDAFVISHTSASDKETREWSAWNSSHTGKSWGESISETQWPSYTKTLGKASSQSGYVEGLGHGVPDIPAVPPSGTPGEPDYDPGEDAVPNTHQCGTFTPATKTTVTKVSDKTFTIRVQATVPAHIICGPCCEHDLPGVEDTWRQGIFYDYAKISQIRLFKIDQASVTGEDLVELTGMEEIFASIKQGDPTYYMNIAQLSHKTPLDPMLWGGTPITDVGAHSNTMYSMTERLPSPNGIISESSYAIPSESSRFGRLRYTLEPTEHDTVVWSEGTRTNKCDGLGATKAGNVIPAGGQGHTHDWATGILYTNSGYTDEYDFHMRRDGLTDKTGYSDKADDKDILTTEWQKFDERRRSKNVATVISDFLILQTSGGDQSIFYFDKESQEVEAQQYFPLVEATQTEMFTDNPNSIFKEGEDGCTGEVKEFYENIGGFNGKVKEPTLKHEPVNSETFETIGVASTSVETIFDNDPANTFTRPTHNGKLLMYEDNIKIKTTAPNRVYTFDDAAIYYKQMVAYYSTDATRGTATGGTSVGTLSQVSLGLEAKSKTDENLSKWGDSLGIPFTTNYTENSADKINNVIVYNPVSTEYATILPVDDINVNGTNISRDQRVEGQNIPNLNDELNKLKVCPLDPGLCEFRVLNCKFYTDTKLAEFDFEPSYLDSEGVSRQNTYTSGSSWVTTNKVNGIEYVLPTGFTVGTGEINSGRHLNAFGTRWSIPLSDLGLTNDNENIVSIKMDFYMETQPSPTPMIVSFYGYDFYLHPWNGGIGGLFNTGGGTSGVEGSGLVDYDFVGSEMNLELDFSFNNVVDSKAKINGVPVDVRVQSSKEVWEVVDGVNTKVQKTVLYDDSSESTITDTMPTNISSSRIGSTLNIGSWGANDNYPASFYIDNLEIWLKGGTHEHNSSCYKTVTVDVPNNAHVHDETCLDSDGGTTTETIIEQDTRTFNYTGGVQTFTAPATGTYTLEVWGAQGGNMTNYNSTLSASGGRGGYSKGNVTLSEGEVIRLYVGGMGNSNSYNGDSEGGWNGGGKGRYAGGGGGGTDIRRSGTALSSRIIVAGGGGGAHTYNGSANGGYGGGYSGGSGVSDGTWGNTGYTTSGGSQSSGGTGTQWNYPGSLGQGGSSSNAHIGGGGGGYYGGAAGTYHGFSGAGGSGYIGGVTGGTMSNSNRSGHGMARITYDIERTITTGTPPTKGVDYVLGLLGGGEGGTYTGDWSSRKVSVGNVGLSREIGTTTALLNPSYTNGYAADVMVSKNYIYIVHANMNYVSMYNKNEDGTVGSRVSTRSWYNDDSTIHQIHRNNSSVPSAYSVYTDSNGYDYLVGWSMDSNYIYKWRINTNNTISNRQTYTAPNNITTYSRGGWDGKDTIHFFNRGNNVLYAFDLNTNTVSTVRTLSSGSSYASSSFTGSGLLVDEKNNEVYMTKGSNQSNGFLSAWSLSTGAYKGTITDVTSITPHIDGTRGSIQLNPVNRNIAYYFYTYNSTIKALEVVLNNPADTIHVGDSGTVSDKDLFKEHVGQAIYDMIIGTETTIHKVDNFTDTKGFYGIDGTTLTTSGGLLNMSGSSTTSTLSRRFNNTSTGYSGANTNNSTGTLGGSISMVNGMYLWTVPSTGVYSVETQGARGSNGNGGSGYGRGARVGGNLSLTAGDRLLMLVGQMGSNPGSSSTDGASGGGGGGTFVTKVVPSGGYSTVMGYRVSPLIVAAGGGGGTDAVYTGSSSGVNGSGSYGTDPNAGSRNGGSFVSNGTGTYGGRSFTSGGSGASYTRDGNTSLGGFGGGGAADDSRTGGGGYTGGTTNGSSALSYNIASSPYSQTGVNATHGFINISATITEEIAPVIGYDIDVETNAVSKIRIGLDNNTTGTQGRLYYKTSTGSYSTTNSVLFTMQANTNNQVIELNMSSATGWTGEMSNFKIEFPNSVTGTLKLRSFEFYGLGEVVESTGVTGVRTFNNTSTGRTGANTNNSSGTLGGNISMQNGMYLWTVPSTGTYTIETRGAQGAGNGGLTGGRGAIMTGDFVLSSGEKLLILVGQQAQGGGGSSQDGGGGGGTFVTKGTHHSTATPLIISGGGGGSSAGKNGINATTSTNGAAGSNGSAGGSGGSGGVGNHSSAGGGFYTNGGAATWGSQPESGGKSFRNGGNAGDPISATWAYGGFGGGSTAHGNSYIGGGAGGGYSGGGGAVSGGVGGGGGSYNSGTNKTATVGNTGHGRVVITGIGGGKAIRANGGFSTTPEALESYKTIIIDNMHLLPEKLQDGTDNPIFSCGFLPLNVGGYSKTIRVLNCTEPHHNGEHYDSSNRICWEPCEDDSNHAIVPETIEISPGNTVRNANFLQLDGEFTIFFPNRGNFQGNNAIGLTKPQAQPGLGYTNSMDTTPWLREKRVRFSFDVLYDNGETPTGETSSVELYKAGYWIELDINQDYYDFYVPIAVSEASNAKVEFEVEAINNGAAEIPSLDFPTSITTDYRNALSSYKASLEPRWVTTIQNGYRSLDSSIYGYKDYFDWKKGRESVLSNTVVGVRNTINNAFPDINRRAKPITRNDNINKMSNKSRSSSLEHLHGGRKFFYVDLVGRIGNFTITDTEDYRFSNFFKVPKASPPEWLIEGFVYEVEESLQNYYIGDQFDIRGNEISAQTKWLNTFGTQDWAQGTIETGRDVNSPNIVNQILTDDINNITQLKGEQLRFGYDIFTSILTYGNYHTGNILVTPYYYALDLTTGDIKPIDVYISKDGVYEPVNKFNNTSNGLPIEPVYDYTMNLDWRTESGRRNYTLQERSHTHAVGDFKKRIIYDYTGYDETNPIPDDITLLPVLGEEEYPVPTGAYNYMGTAQAMVLNPKHRTFVGSAFTNGGAVEMSKWSHPTDGMNPGEKLLPILYTGAVQRWHFKLGIPSSSVFVEAGETDITQGNIDKIMNEDHVILSTISVIAQGEVWSIEYTQPWVSSIAVDGSNYNITTDTLGVGIPPIVAVYSSESSSALDVDIIKTH